MNIDLKMKRLLLVKYNNGTNTIKWMFLVIDDIKKNRVSIEFPGTLQLIMDPSGNKSRPCWIQWTRNIPIQTTTTNYYFLIRILLEINPRNCTIEQNKSKRLVSELFSVSDEAFGLMILYNEYHVWELVEKSQREKNVPRK